MSELLNQLLSRTLSSSPILPSLRAILPSYQLKEQILSTLLKIWARFPKAFDETLFKKAELLFALTNNEFKEQRLQKHLTRLIVSLFLIKKNLRKMVTLYGEKRHLQFRLIQTSLQFPFGSKSVLGLFVGICLFDKQETFKEKHLLLAGQKFLPHLQIVKGSLVLHHDLEDSIQLVYAEFEKKEGGRFSCEEISRLKKGLHTELAARVEKNIPTLFMVRNEEEVMKNILILSRELDLSHEIPEMMIHFEQQLSAALSFTIILVRVLEENSQPLEEAFQNMNGVRFILDRQQIIGYLNNKKLKEATVFRLEISLEESLLRSDSSINFYLARQKIKDLLLQAIGPVRDFNGGMILNQGELLSQLKEAFPEISRNDPLLIENFFYSLSPIENQTTLPLFTLCHFFQMFLSTTSEKEFDREFPFVLKTHEEAKNLYVVIQSEDLSLFKKIEKKIGELYLKETLVTFKLNIQNFFVMGFLLNKEKERSQTHHFLQQIDTGIETWKQEIKKKQVARLAILHVPTSFDPRVVGDENTRVVLKMLFEGLMRIGKDGKPACALAESITILPDKKTYIFRLRPSFWSNGSPLIAYDFEYAWKKILSPEFDSPYTSNFYPIKNARLAKEGAVSLDHVGIKAIDELTLQVTLENPISYFLELTTLPIFSPIPHQIELIHPNWAFQEGDAYICNGPFCLKKNNRNYGYEFKKNLNYWDAPAVSLDQIFIKKITDDSILEMFEKGSIDWIGRHFPYWDPIFSKRFPHKMVSLPSPKVAWCVFNTQKFPFNNPKIRKALAYSIDKEQCIASLGYADAVPAHSPLPLCHSQSSHDQNGLYNPDLAQQLFEEALEEIGLMSMHFPSPTIIFPSVLFEKIAQLLQQQWKNILGISCNLAFNEWPEMFSKICRADFQICLLSWTSWFNDPIYTLNAFKYGSEKINFSRWENPQYQYLLDLADSEDFSKRLFFLREAEKILIDHMPVTPLFFERSQCMSQNYFHISSDSFYGYPDFKWAFIDRTKIEDNFLN